MIDFFIKNIYVVKSRKNEMGGACSMYGRKEVLLGKPEGNRPLRRPRRRLTLRSLTLYIYGAPILDVSRSHTTTQHSR